MFRRLFFVLFAYLSACPAIAADLPSEESLWNTLRSGGAIVLIRHAVTDPGVGDPPGFTLDDCSTQRNLSAKGRADAKRIGEVFRKQKVPIADVLSSRWCRCIDTAQLAFGRVTPVAMLDSMFNDSVKPAHEKVREVFTAVGRRTGAGNLILVTHAQNIQALTEVSPSPGEMLVVTMDGPRKFQLLGRLDVTER